jgi:hypothetical protein
MTKKLLALTVLLLAAVTISRVYAQSAPPVDPKIVFKVSLVNNQREFHIGETIPLQLSFSSAVKKQYQINVAQYDRSGRMDYEQFIVSPAKGAVDPLPDHTGSMGGLTSYTFLSTEPWSIKLNLNEWVRFTQPGDYRLTVVSNRITVRDPSSSYGGSPVAARSNELTLKIVVADPVWQKQVGTDAAVRSGAAAGGGDASFSRNCRCGSRDGEAHARRKHRRARLHLLARTYLNT